MRLAALLAIAVGCHGSGAPADAYVVLDAPAHLGAGPGGGLLPALVFAVVGDSRPANMDDTASYPTAIVQHIFSDVASESPAPAFAVTTGDYQFASISGTAAAAQLALYTSARAAFSGLVYPAMGNHECTAATESNCGPGLPDGTPATYSAFMAKLIEPIGETRPYYVERFAAMDGSWTAKVVVIAANSWSDTQARWLDLVLGEPTTYTFAIRHEPAASVAAPGVTPSEQIFAKHAVTLVLVGHTHTYAHDATTRELVVGNGGAPLSSGVDYGYTMIARRPDGTLAVTAYDYATHAVVDQFAIAADGSPAP